MSKMNPFPDKDYKLIFSPTIRKYVLEKKKYFERPKVSNIEIKIFLNRLIEMFEILMTKLEFVASIPLILSYAKLPEILNEEGLTKIKNTFSFYSYFQKDSQKNKPSYLTKINISRSEGISRSSRKCSNSYKNNESYKLMEENTNVFNTVQILISNEYICQISKKYQKDIEKSTINFMRQIKYFMEFIILKTKLKPNEERNKELLVRNICKEIEETRFNISESIVSLDKQKVRHQIETKQLSEKVKNSLQAWKKITEDFENQLEEVLKNSDNNLAESLAKFNKKLNHNKQILEYLKIQVQKEKVKNKKIELEIKGKKLKIESQLMSLITKFDSDVNDRQETYDELMNECNTLEQEKSQLIEDIDVQSIIYQKIITEKKEKEYKIFIKKCTKFVKNRSAKIIQRWWRNILANKKKKKKKKKKGNT